MDEDVRLQILCLWFIEHKTVLEISVKTKTKYHAVKEVVNGYMKPISDLLDKEEFLILPSKMNDML